MKHVPAIVRLLAGLGLWLAAGLGVQAATVALVLSDDSAVYQETADAIESGIGGGHKLVRVVADKLAASESSLAEAKLMLAVGVKAAEQIAARAGKTPVLAILVPRDWYLKGGRTRLSEGGRISDAVVLDQPYSRQMRLIKSSLPGVAKVGVIVGQGHAGQLAEMETAAHAQQLQLVSAVVDSEAGLVEALEKTLAESDTLLAVPDPVALNRNTVQSLFITSYRYRDPVVGYSKSLSRAGALVSLFSTSAQIGRQAGEVAQKLLAGGKHPGLQWPKYFSVSINSHVARSLDIELPAEEDLLRNLQEGSGND
jgi:putative tryptophan/tyrosine transport system substrate-binding protein